VLLTRLDPRRLDVRRLALVAAPAAAALAIAGAGAIGIVRSAERPATGVETTVGADAAAPEADRSLKSGAPPPVRADPTRPQRVEASLTLRVEDVEALSDAARRAGAIARDLGGFVAAVSYDAGGERGSATLTLRVPVARVQAALARLSALGTILAQQTSLEDVQARLDELDERAAALRGDLAAAEEELRRPGLAARERAELRARIAALGRELRALEAARAQTNDEARLATLTVSLTTEEGAGAPARGGRLGRLLDEAGAILLWELAALINALAVVGPLAVVAGGAWLGLRARRRREETHLLAER
jgi:hypothetical protein